MTRGPGVIRVGRRLGASSKCAFDAWLDPDLARGWLFATATRPLARVDIDARVGGAFRLVERPYGENIEHAGAYLEILPHRRLVFTLSVERFPRLVTRVIVEIAPLDAQCALTLTHEGVPPDCLKCTKARWTGILYGLGATLDSRTGEGNLPRPRSENQNPSTTLRSTR